MEQGSILDSIFSAASKGAGIYFLARRAEAENQAIKYNADADRAAKELALAQSKATQDKIYQIGMYALGGAGIFAALMVGRAALKMVRS